MRYAVILLLVLSACSDWPDAGGGPLTERQGPFPELLPIADLIGQAPGAEGGDADRLAARAAGLRARAAILRRPASNQAEMEALRARLAL